MNVEALQAQLYTLHTIVESLADEVYATKVSRTSGTIGEHVRHTLDHARALLALDGAGDLTYDARLRGTRVETDAVEGMREIVRVCTGLDALRAVPADRQIRLHVLADASRPPVELLTTIGRELAFVVQHTIHHCALIAVLLERRGIATPARFGYAPSTPARS
jgi:uncharacterized damage-inducible protein DinB